MKNLMNPQKILPWIARKTGLGETFLPPIHSQPQPHAIQTSEVASDTVEARAGNDTPPESALGHDTLDMAEPVLPKTLPTEDLSTEPDSTSLGLLETKATEKPDSNLAPANPTRVDDTSFHDAPAEDASDSLRIPLQLDWLWTHQQRMSHLSLSAFQNTCDFWQHAWQGFYPTRQGKTPDKAA
jgi:hypothetical protein